MNTYINYLLSSITFSFYYCICVSIFQLISHVLKHYANIKRLLRVYQIARHLNKGLFFLSFSFFTSLFSGFFFFFFFFFQYFYTIRCTYVLYFGSLFQSIRLQDVKLFVPTLQGIISPEFYSMQPNISHCRSLKKEILENKDFQTNKMI